MNQMVPQGISKRLVLACCIAITLCFLGPASVALAASESSSDTGSCAQPAASETKPAVQTRTATKTQKREMHLAAEDSNSGYCGRTYDDGGDGKNIRWSYKNGVLTLTGSGQMDFWNDEDFWGQDSFPGWRAAGLNDKITKVVIGEGITDIGSAAFAYMTKLQSITLPSTIKDIDQLAFIGCSSLSNVKLNDGLRSIGSSAFDDTAVTSLRIPNSVNDLSTDLFGFKNYTSGEQQGLDVSDLVLSQDNPNYRVVDNVLYKLKNGSLDTLVHCSDKNQPEGTFTVPDGVVGIDSSAFAYAPITKIVFDPQLQRIGGDAFFESDLESVYIPSNVKSIEWGAFRDCDSLTSVSGCAGLKEVNGFCYDSNLTQVTLEEGPRSIGDRSFASDGMASFVIPKSVTEVQEEAFWGCENLSSINLDRITKIGDTAFCDCSNLKSVTFSNSLKSVGQQAFWGSGLVSARIPQSVTSIGNQAFPTTTAVTVDAQLIETSTGAYVSPKKYTQLKYSVTYRQNDARSMLKSLNAFRTGKDAWYWDDDDKTKVKAKNLSKLAYDYDLEKTAMKRAAEIAVYFSHTRPDGSDYDTAFTGTYSSAGENIAYGYSTASQALEAWKEADEKYDGQGHRRNMLSDDFNVVGIAHVVYDGVDYWVQDFAETNAPNATATSAKNGSGSASILLKDTAIKKHDAVVPSSSFVFRGSNGKARLPQVKATNVSFKVEDDVVFIDKASVGVLWSPDDESVVSISGNDAIFHVEKGSTYLRGYVFGRQISARAVAGKLSLSGAKVSGIKSATCSGKAIKQNPKVTLDGAVLRAGSDYALSYRNNIKPGVATVTVSGKGGFNGSVSHTFDIYATTVKVNEKTITVGNIAKAVKKAHANASSVQTVQLGSKVSGLSRNAFAKYRHCKTLKVGTKKLSKKSIKGSLKGSKVKTIKVSVSKKKSVNKRYVKKYKSYFAKKNSGRSVRIS